MLITAPNMVVEKAIVDRAKFEALSSFFSLGILRTLQIQPNTTYMTMQGCGSGSG